MQVMGCLQFKVNRLKFPVLPTPYFGTTPTYGLSTQSMFSTWYYWQIDGALFLSNT